MGEVDGMETASADPGAVSCPPLGRHRLVTVNGPGAALAVPGREWAQVTLFGLPDQDVTADWGVPGRAVRVERVDGVRARGERVEGHAGRPVGGLQGEGLD